MSELQDELTHMQKNWKLVWMHNNTNASDPQIL